MARSSPNLAHRTTATEPILAGCHVVPALPRTQERPDLANAGTADAPMWVEYFDEVGAGELAHQPAGAERAGCCRDRVASGTGGALRAAGLAARRPGDRGRVGAEMTGHLGHPPGGLSQGSNVRNGSTGRTVQTDLGPVRIQTPVTVTARLRPSWSASARPGWPGWMTRSWGYMPAGWPSATSPVICRSSTAPRSAATRSAGSRTPCSRTCRCGRTRPLESVYPIVCLDAMVVKVREDRSVKNRSCYLALGVTCERDREVLGIWWQDTEGSRASVVNGVEARGRARMRVAASTATL